MPATAQQRVFGASRGLPGRWRSAGHSSRQKLGGGRGDRDPSPQRTAASNSQQPRCSARGAAAELAADRSLSRAPPHRAEVYSVPESGALVPAKCGRASASRLAPSAASGTP
ncbi:hypothetical protein H920_07358 [Fukomys damarensis]|uniref:Uncharacterized protein n=1 Tax=Fukomys damarensis TaxID=885580 RepID=A0A091E7Z1_FUKDA|nr:hypothetical protein H920_07358 [Fukomys damarensis]